MRSFRFGQGGTQNDTRTAIFQYLQFEKGGNCSYSGTCPDATEQSRAFLGTSVGKINTTENF